MQPTPSDTYQAISRAVRMCSHSSEKRGQVVAVHAYVAVAPATAPPQHRVALGQEALHVLRGYSRENKNQSCAMQ